MDLNNPPAKVYGLITLTPSGICKFLTFSPLMNKLCAICKGLETLVQSTMALLEAKSILHHAAKSEMYTANRFSQPLKASSPIEIIDGGIFTRVRVQSMKALFPIVLADSGIVTLYKDAPQNAYGFILFIPIGICKSVIFTPFTYRLCATARGFEWNESGIKFGSPTTEPGISKSMLHHADKSEMCTAEKLLLYSSNAWMPTEAIVCGIEILFIFSQP